MVMNEEWKFIGREYADLLGYATKTTSSPLRIHPAERRSGMSKYPLFTPKFPKRIQAALPAANVPSSITCCKRAKQHYLLQTYQAALPAAKHATQHYLLHTKLGFTLTQRVTLNLVTSKSRSYHHTRATSSPTKNVTYVFKFYPKDCGFPITEGMKP